MKYIKGKVEEAAFQEYMQKKLVCKKKLEEITYEKFQIPYNYSFYYFFKSN